jgi:hypothetical protein
MNWAGVYLAPLIAVAVLKSSIVKILITIAAMLSFIVGCTSFRTTEGQATEVAVSELAIGDTVQIINADAEKLRFTIEAIEDDALIGKNIRVPIGDIRLVSVERIDPGKTAVAGLTTGAIIGLALMIAGIFALAP